MCLQKQNVMMPVDFFSPENLGFCFKNLWRAFCAFPAPDPHLFISVEIQNGLLRNGSGKCFFFISSITSSQFRILLLYIPLCFFSKLYFLISSILYKRMRIFLDVIDETAELDHRHFLNRRSVFWRFWGEKKYLSWITTYFD